MSFKIMVLEDEKVTQAMIIRSLGSEYDIEICESLAAARLSLNNNHFDLVILDRLLPDGDGLEICQELRSSSKSDMPIIFLSSKNLEPDKVVGLYAGADDYIVKPFGPLELKARVQARLRKTTEFLKMNDVTVNLSKFQAFLISDGKTEELPLTRLELKLLILFMQSPEHVFSREMLLSKAWGDKLNVSDRVVDTHLSHLRKKLRKSSIAIQSVHGEGYRLEKIISKKAI